MAVNMWKSYVCTAVEETNIESILAVMNITDLVVEMRPEKIQARTIRKKVDKLKETEMYEANESKLYTRYIFLW